MTINRPTNEPNDIIRIKGLKADLKILLFNIADLLNRKIEINQGLLSHVCDCSVSSIKRYLNELEELGYISRITKYINKKRQSVISINWNKIHNIAVPINTEEVVEEELVEVEIKEEPSKNIKQKCEIQKQDNIPMESPTMTWEQYKIEYGYVISKIIHGFKSNLKINHKQAEEDLKSLLRKSVSKPYKDRIISIINNNVYQNIN